MVRGAELPTHHLETLGEDVLLVGGEGDDVGAGVGGFDAGEVRIGVVGEVGQALGLFDPGIPDHGHAAAGLADDDGAPALGIDQVDGLGGFVVAVHLAIKDDGAALLNAVWGEAVLDVVGLVQPVDGGGGDVLHAEIGVERAGRCPGGLPGVFDMQGDAELRAHPDVQAQRKWMRPIGVGDGVIAEVELEADAGGILCDGAELPEEVADEAVRGFICLCGVAAEPGPADGDAAADGLPWFEEGLGAEVKHGCLPGGGPLHDVRAV